MEGWKIGDGCMDWSMNRLLIPCGCRARAMGCVVEWTFNGDGGDGISFRPKLRWLLGKGRDRL